MTSEITIIDYGMGNLKSVARAFEKVGATVCVTSDKKKIKGAGKIVLPGVGAFAQCMENLEKFDLIPTIKDTIATGKDFLGICLGLQLLFDYSEEGGKVKGLGIIPGVVKKFNFTQPTTHTPQPSLPIPHMGWNEIKKENPSNILEDIPDKTDFYFVHSYYVIPEDNSVIATTTDYGITFCSSIQKDNIFATQFHPEKSQTWGLELIENFLSG